VAMIVWIVSVNTSRGRYKHVGMVVIGYIEWVE